jgi:hypothetical protein
MAQTHKIAKIEPPMVGIRNIHSNECRAMFVIRYADLRSAGSEVSSVLIWKPNA